MQAQRVEQGLGLENVDALLAAIVEGVQVAGVFVFVDDQRGPDFLGKLIAKLVHLRELVAGVDVQQRERQFAGMKRLLGQAHHHGRVLADRVQHDRPLEFRGHFTHNVNALGLELLQM